MAPALSAINAFLWSQFALVGVSMLLEVAGPEGQEDVVNAAEQLIGAGTEARAQSWSAFTSLGMLAS